LKEHGQLGAGKPFGMWISRIQLKNSWNSSFINAKQALETNFLGVQDEALITAKEERV